MELQTKIRQLKKKKNALILAHYYQDPQIQEIADHIGDSLGLSQKAHQTDADIILKILKLLMWMEFLVQPLHLVSPIKVGVAMIDPLLP